MRDIIKFDTIFMNVLNMSGKALLYDSDLSFINDIYSNTGLQFTSRQQLCDDYETIGFDQLQSGDIAFYSTPEGNFFYGTVLGVIDKCLIYKSAEMKLACISKLSQQYDNYIFEYGISLQYYLNDVIGGNI